MFTKHLHRRIGLLIALSVLWVWPQGTRETSAFAQVDPTTRFAYDANGNLATRTDANGAATTYKYDVVDHLTEIRYPDDTAVTFEYDALGRRTTMRDALGETRYDYDFHGHVARVTDLHGQTLTYEYDPRGLVISLIYPDGTRVAYAWDMNGQLVRAEDPAGHVEYRYDEAGKLMGRTLPNDVTSSYGYDAANRLTTIEHRAPDGHPLLSIGYAYDQAGNRTEMTRIVSNGAPEVTHYGYDELYRLTQVSYPDGETVTYEYDSTGNRLGMTSSKTGATRYEYDELGRLVAIQGPDGDETLTYDANGNLILRKLGGKATRYAWDYENRLIGVEDGSTKVEFRYDGDGRRLEKIVDGQKTEYVQHGALLPQVVLERTGKEETRSFLGLQHFGETDAEAVKYYLEDGLGSAVGATDAAGMLLGTTEYDVFGQVRGSPLSVSFGFTGEQFETQPGLIFLRARYYAPTIGRFVSSDAYPPSIESPRTQNRYTYVNNNPVNMIDPFGLQGSWPNNGPLIDRSNQVYVDMVRASLGFLSLPLTPLLSDGIDRTSDGITTMNRGDFLLAAGTYGMSGVGLARSIATVLTPSTYLTPASIFNNYYGLFTSGWSFTSATLKLYGIAIPSGPGNLAFGSTGKYIDSGISIGRSMIGPSELGRAIAFGSFAYGQWAQSVRESRQFSGGGGGFVYNTDLVQARREAALPELPRSAWGTNCCSGQIARYFGDEVGGVSLDQAAKAFIDLTEITGAVYDPALGQLVLIGSQDVSLPPMAPDDLAVAIRAVYSGEDPGVTMVPIDPTMQDITQRVEYFGHTENTRFGQMMFEADRYLKGLAGGQDTLTGQPLSPDVPGFRSEVDLMVDLGITDVPWHRNWFVPGEITLKRSADGQSVVFDEASIKLESRFIRFDADGNPQDLPGSSPVTDRFTQFVTNHYDELAAGKPELAELVRLAKIVGVVKWLHDANIPVDLGWLSAYPIQKVDTPTTTRGLVAQKSSPDGSYTITSMGGVTYETPNTYAADVDGQASALGAKALAARPAEMPIAWSFENDGQDLKAVALNLAPTKIVGGYADAWTDASVPLAGGMAATITREYNSLDPRSGSWGPGWRLALPSLEFQRASAPDQPNAYLPQAFINNGSSRSEFQGITEDGLYMAIDPASPYRAIGVMGSDPDNVGGLPEGFAPVPAWFGEPIEITNDQGQQLAYAAFAVFRKDGGIMAFDPSGRLVSVRDAAGNQISYQYEDERLVAIADTKERGLRLEYDPSGRLSDLTGSDGSMVRYDYDAAGRLITVSDEVGPLMEYAYDANNRLVIAKDDYGRIVQENSYDELGRAVSMGSGNSEAVVTASFDDPSGTVRYANTDGATFASQYDNMKRLTKQSDALGNTVSYTYDPNDRVTSITDPNGQTTQLSYDENGNLAEILSPKGEQTRWLEYNELGLPQTMIDATDRVTFVEYDEYGRTIGVSSGYQLETLSEDKGIQYSAVDPVFVAYSYDPSGNLIAVQDAVEATTQIAYDELGNLTEISLPEGGKIAQTYDERSRLKTVTDPAGFQIGFDYDIRGQVTQVSSPAGVIRYDYSDGRLSAVTDPAGRITQYAYRDQGRLARVTEPTGEETTYEYDPDANLSAVVDAQGRRLEFQYDPMGRLVARIQRGAAVSRSITPTPQSISTIIEAPTSQAPTPATTPIGSTSAVETPKPSKVGPGLVIGLAVLGVLIVLVLLLSLLRSRKKRRASEWDWGSDEASNFSDTIDDHRW